MASESAEGLDYDRDLQLFELLQRYSIGRRRAQKNATDELGRWEVADVEAVLRQIKFEGRDQNPCGPEFNIYRRMGIGTKAFLYSCLGLGFICLLPIFIIHSSFRFLKHWKLSVFRKTWNEGHLHSLVSLVSGADSYVKAPIELIEKSVEESAALCINRSGQFKLMTSGYTVMSHVWEETMGWNGPSGFGKVDLSLRKKGIGRSHFLKFFNKCGAEWLWVDVIAMPEILEDMSEQERRETERLRVGVINSFATICRGADQVVVLDSLVMKLETGSPVDVAIVLCLGGWITGMWALTEARLAHRIVIKTGNGEMDLDEMIEILLHFATEPTHRYFNIAKALFGWRGDITSRDVRCQLEDLVQSYRHAYTGEDIDTVRAAFPLLGLTWEAGWTKEDGLRFLISQLSDESPLLASFCAERGMHEPYSWAPSRLNMLKGSPSPTLTLSEDGVRGKWKTIAVSGIQSQGGDGTRGDVMKLDFIMTNGESVELLHTHVLTTWPLATLESKITAHRLNLLYPQNEGEMTNFVIAIANEDAWQKLPSQENSGSVAGSGFLQDLKIDSEVQQLIEWTLR